MFTFAVKYLLFYHNFARTVIENNFDHDIIMATHNVFFSCNKLSLTLIPPKSTIQCLAPQV